MLNETIKKMLAHEITPQDALFMFEMCWKRYVEPKIGPDEALRVQMRQEFMKKGGML
jgi:hypothetical protein